MPMGTTGECLTVSHEEHELVIKVTVDRVAGRMPVVAGAGSNSTSEATLTAFAKKCGADAVLLVNPYYNKPNQEGLYLHFKAIADATDMPIVLYNIPSRCGITMQPETVARLWNECPQVVAIKAVHRIAGYCEQDPRALPNSYSSGDDTLTLPLMSVGGCGVSVLSTLLRNWSSQLWIMPHQATGLMPVPIIFAFIGSCTVSEHFRFVSRVYVLTERLPN